MAYGLKYILPFENDLNEFYEIYFEFIDFIGASTQIFGADNCLTLRSTTGDENKFEPLLGTECLINIIVGKVSVDGIEWDNDTLQIDDLIAQHDNDIRITVYKDQDYSKSIFQGFVVVEDNSQPLLDPPFVLSIRALDCLGLLKGVDLTNFNGDLFAGRLSIQDWIGNILMKTGQTLNIRFYFPIYPSSVHIDMSTGIPIPIIIPDTYSPLSRVFLDAITFQQGELTTTTDPSVNVKASEADDCYTALEKIIRCLRCRLFQQDGVWNVVNIFSYMNPNGYSYYEVAAGTLTAGVYSFSTVATALGVKYDVPIGGDQIIHPVNDNLMRYLKLATKWIKLTYNYDQSLNKICNQGLNQGLRNATYDGTIDSTIEDPNIKPIATLITHGFDLFCFDHLDSTNTVINNDNAWPYPSIAPAKRAYVRSVLDPLGYEIDRYAVIEKSTHPLTFIRSSKLFIDSSDIIQISFNWRTKNNIHNASGTTYDVCAVYLYGDDGTYWALSSFADGAASIPIANKWWQCDSNFTKLDVPNFTAYCSTPEMLDSNAWASVQVNQNPAQPMAKAPVSGKVEILFVCYQDRVDINNEYWIKNIDIKILPYLQGSYAELKGDYNFSTSANDIKQTQSEEVEISDSPKRYFKGALVDSTGELIPTAWHRLGFTESYRFTQIMEYLIYTNTNRIMEKIEGDSRGLTYVDPGDPSIVRQYGYLNSYFFLDHTIPTKKFMLTSFEDDYTTGIGRRVFVEVLEDQNDPGFDVPDSGNYLFQYIFQ